MSAASDKAAQRAESLETLRPLLPAGTEILSIVRSVSSSGMSRTISFHVIEDGELRNITAHVGYALGYPIDRDRFALKIKGAGMDMCFATVYHLGRALFPDGFDVPAGVYGRNGDTSGHDNDGGYALRSHQI